MAQGVPGRLRPRIFLTFRHYQDGSSSAKRTGHLYPKRYPWYSLSEAESTSGHMVLSGVPWNKSPVTPPGIDPGTVRLVMQCLNHYATRGPKILGAFFFYSLPLYMFHLRYCLGSTLKLKKLLFMYYHHPVTVS